MCTPGSFLPIPGEWEELCVQEEVISSAFVLLLLGSGLTYCCLTPLWRLAWRALGPWGIAKLLSPPFSFISKLREKEENKQGGFLSKRGERLLPAFLGSL